MAQISHKIQKANKANKATEIVLPVQSVQSGPFRLPDNCLIVPMIVLREPEPVKHGKRKRN